MSDGNSGKMNRVKRVRIDEVREFTSWTEQTEKNSTPVEDKWVYILRDHGWGFQLEWEFRVANGKFHKVDWRTGHTKDLREPKSTSEAIELEDLDEKPVWVCLSQIQLPYERITQFVGKGQKRREHVWNRCRQIFFTEAAVVDDDEGTAFFYMPPDQAGCAVNEESGTCCLYLLDPFPLAQRYQENYLDALARLMEANMRLDQFVKEKFNSDEYKKSFLAKMARKTAEAYQKEDEDGDLPYDDEFDEKGMHSQAKKFDDLLKERDRKEQKVEDLKGRKQYFARQKVEIMSTARYSATREDYMFDAQSREEEAYKDMILQKEKALNAGAMYSSETREYFGDQLFKNADGGAFDTENWYYRYFLDFADVSSSGSHCYLDGSQYGSSDDDQVAAVATTFALMLMTIYHTNSSVARQTLGDAMQAWTGRKAGDPMSLDQWLGEKGFPSRAEHQSFQDRLGVSEAQMGGATVLAAVDHIENMEKRWPTRFLSKSKFPMMSVLNLAIFADAVDQGDALGILSAGSEVVLLLVEAANIPAAMGAGSASLGVASGFAVGSIAVVLAGFLGFTVGMVKMLEAAQKGRKGLVLGWAVFSAGAAIGAVVGLGTWALAASGGVAASTGWTGFGLVAAGLMAIGGFIVILFTEDDFQTWFGKCPWGPDAAGRSLTRNLQKLLALIGRPRVDLQRDGADSVRLVVEPTYAVRGQTRYEMDLTLSRVSYETVQTKYGGRKNRNLNLVGTIDETFSVSTEGDTERMEKTVKVTATPSVNALSLNESEIEYKGKIRVRFQKDMTEETFALKNTEM